MFRVNVRFAPEFTGTRENMTAEAGRPLQVQCLVSSWPSPTSLWLSFQTDPALQLMSQRVIGRQRQWQCTMWLMLRALTKGRTHAQLTTVFIIQLRTSFTWLSDVSTVTVLVASPPLRDGLFNPLWVSHKRKGRMWPLQQNRIFSEFCC